MTNTILAEEEYVEQAYLFRALKERSNSSEPIQDLMAYVKEEILATTKLPMAIDYLLSELNHVGTMALAMERMAHYFAPVQAFLVASAESDKGTFDIRLAFDILARESQFRSESACAEAMFFYQFETICRNRLDYDSGLNAIARDPIYNEDWKHWILKIRSQLGLVGIADLVYVHSEYYLQQEQSAGHETETPAPLLFNEKVGRIALANRTKQPLYFFSALQRQMKYPQVVKPVRKSTDRDALPKLIAAVQRLESRIKMLEDEQRGQGIDLSQFYRKKDDPSTN